MACIECRRRRIKCDNVRPTCHHCSRLSKKCEYAAYEQKRGPKRRSVKELEDRLASIEAMLQVNQSNLSPLERESSSSTSTDSLPESTPHITVQPSDFSKDGPNSLDMFGFIDPGDFQPTVAGIDWLDVSNASSQKPAPNATIPITTSGDENNFPELGEIQELHEIFFNEAYPCMPILHREKHDPKRSSLESQDPLCLRYIMWAHAAQRSAKYADRASKFYRNARMHLEHDEMQGDGLGLVTVAHVQACCLIAAFEAETGTPARAFMSNRRAIALSSMVGLHIQDKAGVWATFKILNPAKDLIDAEERRRTFWYLFWSDRWASSASGKSPNIKDYEITTLLPTSERAFKEGLPDVGPRLQDVFENGLDESTSPLTVAVLTGCLLSRMNTHLRQLQEGLNEQRNVIQSFWQRHQQLDNQITRFLHNLPKDMQPTTTKEPLAFFVYMCFQEFLVTLFQTAATFAQKHPTSIETVSKLKSRSRQAAGEIILTMRYASKIEIHQMYPSTPSCLYLASSPFIDDLKGGHDVEHARAVIRYILHTIRIFRKHWKMSQMFLEQLLDNLKDCDIDVEIEPADTEHINCYQLMGDDFDVLGPLFADTSSHLRSKGATKTIRAAEVHV